MKNANASVKSIVAAKMIIVGILAHVFVGRASIENVLLMIQWLRMMKLYMLWILYQQTWQTLYQQIWPILYQQMCQQILMVKKVR